MTLVIMAAGMGSRFGGLKQIEPINDNGEFIIDYSIYDAIKVGFTKIVFIIKKENYDLFKETVGKRIEKYIEVEYVFQEMDKLPKGFNLQTDRTKPWGTGHAILCTKDKVNEPFAVINADDFYGKESFEALSKYLKDIDNSKLTGAMVGYKLVNTVSENGSVKRGVAKVNNNKLEELIESKIVLEDDKFIAYPLDNSNNFEVDKEEIVSMNMFAFTTKIFDYLEEQFIEFLNENIDSETNEFLIPTCVFELIKEGKMEVDVLETDARWLGITYREDKDSVVNEIKKLHENNVYNKRLWD